MEKITFSPLVKEEKTEVAVIGGGFCGLFSAYLLQKEGKKVSVFEKDGFYTKKTPPEILQYDAEHSLFALKNKFGTEKAVAFYNLEKNALSGIKSVACETGYEDFTDKDIFTFSDGGASRKTVEEEYRLRKYGGFDVELIDGKDGLDLFSFPFECGIYSPKGGAYADRSDFCTALLCFLSVKGASLYENTRIDFVTQNPDGFLLESGDGVSVSAETVFDCRGLSLLSRYPFLGKREAAFFIKTAPVTDFVGWHNRAFLRDIYEKPLFFLCDKEGRVTVAGADTFYPKKETGFFGALFSLLSERKFSGLEKTLYEYFWQLDAEISEQGVFSYLKTKNGLPTAGEDPIRNGYFYLTSGNKNTLVSAFIAAKSAVGKFLRRPTAGGLF